MPLQLNQTDLTALAQNDHAYLNQKGADFYTREQYDLAVEYYRLAAAMGNIDSLSNLGYCYLYGRSIPKNTSLALAYFDLAARRDCIDALYKLGSIHETGWDDLPADAELALYYYHKALDAVAAQQQDPTLYPSLFFAMGKGYMPGGLCPTDLARALAYLHLAQQGFQEEIESGITYHENALARLEALLDSPCFIGVSDPLQDAN